MRKTALAIAFMFGLAAPAAAQAPPAVPALPDTARLTTYSLTASTCACSVGFALFNSGTDVDNWIQVFIGGVARLSTDPTYGWALTSPTGSIGSIPRPITNAVLTFNAVQTATVTIVGAQRPRRLSQFSENRGVPARDLNQAITTDIAALRELWDKSNRSIVGQPGEVLTPLPAAAARVNQVLTFDINGQPTMNPVIVPSGFNATAVTWTALQTFTGGMASSQVGTGTTSVTCVAGVFQFPCLNPFVITSDNINAASPSSALDGWQFNHSFGGSSLQGARQSLDVIANFTAASSASNTNRNYVPLVGQMNVLSADGGTGLTVPNAKGAFFGGNLVVRATAAATNLLALTGLEIDVSNGGSTVERIGLSTASFPGSQGVIYDAAISIGAVAGTSNIGWINGILLSRLNGRAPLDATNGCVICTDGNLDTIKTGFDLSSYTITGNFLNSSGFAVTGNGQTVIASVNAPQLAVNSTGTANAAININTATAAHQSSFTLSDATVAKWQFIKQTDNTLLIFDNTNSINMTTYTAGAIGAGFVTFNNSTPSTSKTTGNVVMGGGLGVALAGYFGQEVVTGVTVVASLPACNAGRQGARYFVTDQNTATAYLGAVTGGGAGKQGVTCDGTVWKQG